MTSVGVDGQVLGGGSRLAAYANFVKIAHTVFALPFVVVGVTAALGAQTVPWSRVALAVIAFTCARFAAMGFNRIVDRRYDALNPRTSGRELVTGRMGVGEAWTLVAGSSLAYFAAVAGINRLCLLLSPAALAWILAYSFTKRFTSLCHLWLGVSLAIAPVGGYLAVTGAWSTPWWQLFLLAGGVASWVAGFDILYSLQDRQFDAEHGLRSTAVAMGARSAIGVARLLHLIAILLLACFGIAAGLGWPYLAGVGSAALLLAWEHRLVHPTDHSRLDAAFFTMNGIISGVVMAGALVGAIL